MATGFRQGYHRLMWVGGVVMELHTPVASSGHLAVRRQAEAAAAAARGASRMSAAVFVHYWRSRSGQVWGHTPEQRVAASTLRR